MDIIDDMIGKSTVKLTVEAPDAIKEKLSGEFILEMAKQLTREIERAMSIEGLPESNIELKLVFDPQTFMEHTSENVTYRRLLLTDKACGVKDFWVKWTRNNGAVAFSMCDAPAEGEITFELGEDVTQKVREKEYRFLVRSDTNKYHYAMGRKNITEWREMIKRAIKRGDLTRVVSELEVADHSSDVHDKLSSLLSSFGVSAPTVEEVAPESDENSEFEEALRKAQEAVLGQYASEDEPEEQSAPDVPFDFSAVVDDGEPEVDFSATEDEDEPEEDTEDEVEEEDEPEEVYEDEAEEDSDEEIEDLAAEDGADESELDEALEDEPEEEYEDESEEEEEPEEDLEEDSEDEEESVEEDAEDADKEEADEEDTAEAVIAEAQAQIRYEYENEARLRAEAECESLKAELKAMREELDSARRENLILTSENQRLKQIAEALTEQKARLEAEKAEEERRLREEIDARIKAENRERERLEEAARLAVIEQRRIEEEKAEAERREEEARREAEELARREEEAKRLEEEREREAERIRRETEIARGNITGEEIPEKSSTVINAADSDYTYISRKVKLLFKNIVDPNITARIYEIIKATVEYYNKESVSIRIKATVPDEKTVVLDFLRIPEEEGELFVNIIKVLGNSNLGITKAIVD